MRLRDLQTDLQNWRVRNFPNSGWEHHFMGMVEEVGELAHALLKQAQRIRGTAEEHEAAAKDAIGDLIIYCMGVCSDRGWILEDIVHDTAQHVMRRDWVSNPYDGGVTQ